MPLQLFFVAVPFVLLLDLQQHINANNDPPLKLFFTPRSFQHTVRVTTIDAQYKVIDVFIGTTKSEGGKQVVKLSRSKLVEKEQVLVCFSHSTVNTKEIGMSVNDLLNVRGAIFHYYDRE